MKTTGANALLQMLADAGVRHLFGNPGTTELPLMDALVDFSKIDYILGLQEVPVMAMADGYAMASGKLGVVNLHISCGLGNAMGMLYNAYREGTPLLITAGQSDRRLRLEEPILWGDMVSVARPWTKWSYEVERIEDLPVALRRAMQTALAPPTGPVFLSIPMDIQSEIAELELTAAAPLDRRVRPPQDAIRRAAEVLAAANNPAILVGSRVQEADAVEELVRVAEALGAPVMSESGTTHGRLSFPATHPQSTLGMPLWSPEVIARLQEYDVLLVVGMDLLRQYVYFEPARAVPAHVKLVHLDESQWQIGKNYPVEVGVLGDVKCSLAELAELLPREMTSAAQMAASQRIEKLAASQRASREALHSEIEKQRGLRPLSPGVLMESVVRAILDNVAVVEEAVTTTNTVLERLAALKNTSGYFGHRGWALGWGLGCSIGVQLAWPDRPVLALLGEGASMYGIQGLWTAARYRIPVTFVICNNAQYQILKIGAGQLQLPGAVAGKYVGLDIAGPEIDFVSLARSLGVEAQRVTEPDELTQVLKESLAGDRPRLIDVPIQRGTPKRLNYG
jgi:benzoylformate decarboxylase